MSSFGSSRERASEALNHAAPMSHTAQVQPEPPGTCKCDIRRPYGTLSADLTSGGIAGSMDDHEADEEGVFAR